MVLSQLSTTWGGGNKLDSYGPTSCKMKYHLDFKINIRTLNYKSARRK